MFSQSYEAFEKLLKDFVEIKIQTDQSFYATLIPEKDYSREKLKGGDEIFMLIKKAGGERFKRYSKKNNNRFAFKELFTIISEVRHAITHSKGNLKSSKIPTQKYYRQLFKHLFPFNDIEAETVCLKFDYKLLDSLLIYLSEFGYQIFKILSEESGYEWKL